MACLHGGASPEEAVYHAVVLEEVAKIAFRTLQLNPKAIIDKCVLDKHYKRKHGKSVYYEQQ